MAKENSERIIVEISVDLVEALESERKRAPGAVPNRSAMIRELLREAIDARENARPPERRK